MDFQVIIAQICQVMDSRFLVLCKMFIQEAFNKFLLCCVEVAIFGKHVPAVDDGSNALFADSGQIVH